MHPYNLLMLLTLTSFPSLILSAPTVLDGPTSLTTKSELGLSPLDPLPHAVPNNTGDQNDLLHHHAGFAWGPRHIGNLRLFLTNPHTGPAGPRFPSGPHVTLHVEKKDSGTYSEVVKMHMVKYKNGTDSKCLSAWDSVTKKAVFDSCFDHFGEAIEKGAGAVKGFVHTLLKNANAVAGVGILVTLGIALVSVLGPLAVAAVV